MQGAKELYLDWITEQIQKQEAGERDAMGIYFELAEIESFCKEAKEQIFPAVVSELDMYDKTQLKEMGIQYQPDGRGTHEFSHLPEWSAMKAQIKAFEESAKKNGLSVVKYSKPIVSRIKTK